MDIIFRPRREVPIILETTEHRGRTGIVRPGSQAVWHMSTLWASFWDMMEVKSLLPLQFTDFVPSFTIRKTADGMPD